jgi:hypothetical protein
MNTTIYIKPDALELWATKGDRWFVPVVYKTSPSEGHVKAEVPTSALQGGWFHPGNCANIRRIARAVINANTVVTSDGIEVKVGQRWRDCDPRMFGRVIRVESVEPGIAVCRQVLTDDGNPTGGLVRISICRMRRNSRGFTLIS